MWQRQLAEIMHKIAIQFLHINAEKYIVVLQSNIILYVLTVHIKCHFNRPFAKQSIKHVCQNPLDFIQGIRIIGPHSFYFLNRISAKVCISIVT